VGGFNTLGHLIASSTFTVTVVTNSTVSRSVILARSPLEGTVNVTVNWQVASDYDEASLSLTPAGGTTVIMAPTVSTSTSVNFQTTVPAGDYAMVITLKKLGLVVSTVTEAVQVYEGYTSAATFDRSISVLGQSYSYTSASPVYPVDFGGASSLDLTVTGALGKSVYLVKANDGTTVAAASTSGAAASAREIVPYDKALKTPQPSYLPDATRPILWEKAEAAAFNADPPPVAGTTPAARSLAGVTRARSIAYGGTDPNLSVGYQRQFWVQDYSGNWYQAPVTCGLLVPIATSGWPMPASTPLAPPSPMTTR